MTEGKIAIEVPRHGFIFPVVKAVVKAMYYLNIVELFKSCGKRLAGADEELQRRYARIAIDIFVMLKWVVIIFLWQQGVTRPAAAVVAWYLIAVNVFVYFYHHVWKDPYDDSEENLRSRFVSLGQSIAFNVTAYAYLYAVVYTAEFAMDPLFTSRSSAGLAHSIAQSTLVGEAGVFPLTPKGLFLSLSQTIVTTIYITVILSCSLPRKTQK